MTPAARSRRITPMLHLLCAGAAQALVKAVEARFAEQTGACIEGRFGAVGAMKEALMGGVPCDVLVVTDTMLRALQANGAIDGDTALPLGRVRTGIAVRAGEPVPDVASATALKATLLAATALFVPDMQRSTAGGHVASMLERIGIGDAMAARLAIFANGATAMAALAERGAPGSIGCTQLTEILCTQGLVLAGPLPDPYGLSTIYSAGVSKTAAQATLASEFVALLCGDATAASRREGGFDSIDDSKGD